MRPRHFLAAAVMAASAMTLAVPAVAATPSPNPVKGAAGQLGLGQGGSQATVADSTATPAATATATTPPPKSTTSPSTDPAACFQSALADPTKLAACLQALGGGGGLPTPPSGGGTPNPATAVQTFLTCAQGALTSQSAAAGEKCGVALFQALGIKQADCLDPTLQPILTALDSLFKGNPSQLQSTLQNLPNTLPKQLQTLPTCLQGGGGPTADPTTTAPKATPTPAKGGVTADPTAAVPVSATPTFTG